MEDVVDLEDVGSFAEGGGEEMLGAGSRTAEQIGDHNVLHLGNTIITSLTFLSLLSWVEVVLYDIRHPPRTTAPQVRDDDLITAEEKQLSTSERRTTLLRKDYLKSAIILTLITIVAIFFFRKFPLRVRMF